MGGKSKRGGFRKGSGRKPIIGQCPVCLEEGIKKEVNLWKGLCKKHYHTYWQQKTTKRKTGKESPEEVFNKVLNGNSFVDKVWEYFLSKLNRSWKYDDAGVEGQYWPSIEEIITRSKGDITLTVFKEFIDWLFSKDCFVTKGSAVKPAHLYNGPMWGAFLEQKNKAVEEQVTEDDAKVIESFNDDLIDHLCGLPPDVDVLSGHRPKITLYVEGWDITHFAVYLASSVCNDSTEIRSKAIALFPDVMSLYTKFKEYFEERVTDETKRKEFNFIFKNYMDGCFEDRMPLRMVLSIKTARNAWVDYLSARLKMRMAGTI